MASGLQQCNKKFTLSVSIPLAQQLTFMYVQIPQNSWMLPVPVQIYIL